METLNFEEWLSGVRAPVTTAHIFKRPDLIAELGKLQGLKERGQRPELFESAIGERSKLDQVRQEGVHGVGGQGARVSEPAIAQPVSQSVTISRAVGGGVEHLAVDCIVFLSEV